MYQVVIVEDDAAQAEIIRSMIECSPRGGELAIEHVVDAESLTARLAEEPAIDVLVMDIELGSEDANGIDLVKRYFPAGCGTQVIYVTGFVEYCTSVYRTEHLYFLVKPFAQDDLDDALSRALERLEADSSKPLSVRLGSRVVLVEPSRISYIESDRRKVRIHAGAEEIEAYASLSDLAAELPASFIQCHKSFLVNMDHVKELKADSVVLLVEPGCACEPEAPQIRARSCLLARAIQAVGRRGSRMPDALLDIIGVVPVQLVFAYALTKMLNIRRLYLFWVLELVFVLLISSFRSSMSVEFRLAASVPLALIPIFLSQGSLARRILVVTLAHLVLFFAELPGGALWMSMTGTPVADYEAVRTHLGAFFLTHAAHMALLVPLLAMLCMLLNRFGSAQERGMGEWLPVLFSLVQLVLVNVMILLPLGYIQESMTYYGASVVLALVGFAVDLLLFEAMGRFAQKRRDDVRATMLEEQLDRYLARCGEFVSDIEHTLKVRHDMGNHVQVVLALSERGNFQEAHEHLACMAEVLNDTRRSEEAVL